MKLYIGVDLGTSAVKLLLMDEQGEIKNVVSKEYPLEFPQPGLSCCRALTALTLWVSAAVVRCTAWSSWTATTT